MKLGKIPADDDPNYEVITHASDPRNKKAIATRMLEGYRFCKKDTPFFELKVFLKRSPNSPVERSKISVKAISEQTFS